MENRMVWKYYNAHPKDKKTTDCVVRAVCTAFEKDYLETRRDLNRAKRDLGFSSYKDRKFLYEYLKDYERLIFKAITGQPRDKARDFALSHPSGTYILSLRGHATICENGYIVDTWDCTYLTVYTAWRIK